MVGRSGGFLNLKEYFLLKVLQNIVFEDFFFTNYLKKLNAKFQLFQVHVHPNENETSNKLGFVLHQFTTFKAIIMKDIFKILEKDKKSHLQKVVPFSSSEFPNSQWQALNLMESSAQQMLKWVSSALPNGYSKTTSKVRLEILKDPGEGEKLFVKAQIYQYNKRNFQLKVFVHEVDHKNRSSKLAKAIYDIEVYSDKSRIVA